MKDIAQNIEHTLKVRKGIDLVHSLVSSTLGPKGLNKILDKGFGAPIVTRDGVSVARAIEVKDDVERMGVELIKEVALKTNEEAGDGTTTSIVVAHAIVEEGMKYYLNPMGIRDSLQLAKDKIIKRLKEISRPIKNNKEIFQIASVSADSEYYGNIIAETFKEVGEDGVITVEESKLPYTETKITEGYELPEHGFVSPFMANKNNGKAEYQDVKILVIGDRISTITEILPFLMKYSEKSKELVIFCSDIESSVVNHFIFNKQQGIFNALVVKCASARNEVLFDIALTTGATLVSKEAGWKLEDLKEEVLGKADKVIADSHRTVIISKRKNGVKQKVAQLKEQLKTEKNDNEYDLIEKRIARLQGGVAVISVGATTEGEMRDLYYKVEDAVNAVKAALREGIVEGGGMTLYRISQELSNDNIGEQIMRKALTAPLKKIISNAGLDYTDIIMNMPKGKGYDAKNNRYVDMIKCGIIDPTLVELCAVEKGISFAGEFLTSDGTIALVRKEPKE